ncbi:MAG: hypothetical protein HRU11_08015 [Parvularculaceae bacterium]|nr:hypothetical protein [Parvularculaceae bacterium]
MSDDTELDYAWLTQNAMRGVVRDVISLTIELGGLPGDHHFYIEFDTNQPGVQLADRLKSQYPERMTIVLQHQFDDLELFDEGFGVTLQFKGTPERIIIPLAAVTQFADPSANFALQFQTQDDAAAEEPSQSDTPEDDPTPPDDQPPSGGADVVSLDRFRKK